MMHEISGRRAYQGVPLGCTLTILPPTVTTRLINIAVDGVIVTDPPLGDPLIKELKSPIPYVTDLGEVGDPNAHASATTRHKR